jgi:hypothetical protein
MPYCPKCGAEYLPGNTRCTDCDLELVDTPPKEEDEDFNADTKSVLLCHTNDLINAEILEEALTEQGIPCLIKSSTGSYSGFGSVSQVMKGVMIFVPETAMEKAIEIAETIIPDFELPNEEH